MKSEEATYVREKLAELRKGPYEARSTKKPCVSVYFNGMSDGLKPELQAITSFAQENNDRALGEKDGSIIVPVFRKTNWGTCGLIWEISLEGVLRNHMYVEPVGNGFGEASFKMATCAYEGARQLGKPTLVLVKKKREANHPEFARRFLMDVKRKDIEYYQTPEQFVEKFRSRYWRIH